MLTMNTMCTALHFAASGGHADVVNMLIQNGTNVNAVDSCEQSILHYAAWKGGVYVAKVLIQNDADVNAVDKHKRTALPSQLSIDMLTLRKCCFRTERT